MHCLTKLLQAASLTSVLTSVLVI